MAGISRRGDAQAMDQGDIFRYKVNFWFLWLAANALALGIGLPLGETVGRSYIQGHGMFTAEIIASLVCEAFLWAARIAVLSRFRMQGMFKRLDAFVWPINEFSWLVMGLFATSFNARQLAPSDQTAFGLTGMVLFASVCGATFWLMFRVMRIPHKSSRLRFLKMFLLALGCFLLATVGNAGLMVLGLQIGEAFLKDYGYQTALLATGLAFGTMIGSVTDFAWAGWLEMPSAADPIATTG